MLAEIKVRYPTLPVIVMTAYSTVKNAVQSMRNGAYDYIAKPFDIDELDITVAKALQFRDIMRDNARMRAELDEQNRRLRPLVGHEAITPPTEPGRSTGPGRSTEPERSTEPA